MSCLHEQSMKKFLYIFLLFPAIIKAQFTESWTTAFNGKGDFSDRYICATSDNNGNIYLAGYTHITDENADFLVSKFNASGELQWEKSWRGSGHGPDIAYAIAYKNGTVYAAGQVSNAGVGFDFFTLALNENGDSLWGANYNETLYNQYDQIEAIAVDELGNVYVTGESDRDPSNIINDDFLTIKYSSTGSQQWVKRFNGVGNATDRPLAISVTPNGNVVVAGRTDNGGDDDYCTIQYDSNGNQLWIQQFDNGGTDRISDMGTDINNNIYVTGRSDNGNDDDFRTLKYNAQGQLLFNVIYDFVGDDRADIMDVNDDGSFVVAGRSDGNASVALNYNYRIVKYTATGTQQWTATYDSPAASDDIVQDIDLSAAGEVLVTGYSDVAATVLIQNDITSIRYSSTGAVQWNRTYSSNPVKEDLASACILDAQGNAWIFGSTEDSNAQRNALLLKYNVQGTVEASNLWGGIGDNSDNAREVTVDASGSVYVCGYSVGKDTDRDMFLMKLNNAGDTLWTRKLSGTLFGSDEEANALALDATGNVIISGYTKNSGTGSDITIQKYSSAGLLAWTATYNNIANESDRSYDLTTDAQGNIYVTGKVDINASPIVTNDEIFTAKYNTNGALLWSVIHAGTVGIDRGRKIHIGASGNVYVCGYKWNGTHNDLVIIKYNSAGAQQWLYTYNSPHEEIFKSSALDGNENIFLLADSHTVDNLEATDIRLIKVNPSGTELWAQTYSSGSSLPCTAEEFAINSTGQVALIGSLATQSAPSYSFDCLVLKYTADGVFVWQNQYNGSAGLDDIGDAITLQSNGQIIVASHTNDGTAEDLHYKMVLRAIDSPNGNDLETLIFSNSDTLNIPNDIIASGSKLIVAGSIWNDNSQRDILVQTYDVTLGEEIIEHEEFSLYPNPASDNIHIQVDDSCVGEIATLYDNTGSAIREFYLKSNNTECSIQDLASGFYILQIGTQQTKYIPFIKH